MASIINKLLGKDTESEHTQKTDTKCESGTCSTSVTGGEKHGVKTESSTGGARGANDNSQTHTVQRDGVNIKSTISTEGSSSVSLANQQKLSDLVSKLGSTHTQIDTYAKNQTEKINEQVQHEIDEVVGRTRREQEELLRKANEHTAQIDQEYRARLQTMVEELDSIKAKRISEIEIELNNQQAGILQAARNEIDALNKKAARLKIGVLESAEAKAAADSRDITASANLDKTSTIHQATGTTTIKSEVSGAATTTTTGSSGSTSAAANANAANREAHATAGGAKHVTETKTVETSAKHQSNDGRQ